MIKVHCFVSCICEVLKKRGVDHRPYYFGVWDADFVINDSYALAYHSEKIDHSFLKNWYRHLYGIDMHEWYKKEQTKEANIATLETLLETRPPFRNVMVMLDLALLPERENKFHQKPFPHYVLLEKTDTESQWLMLDPDYRWEGVVEKERILEAIRSPDVGGGFYFDAKRIHHPTPETVEAYFQTCMKLHSNPLTEGVRTIVEAYVNGSEKARFSALDVALKQLPVLAIRKYAYEHAFAYFWKELGFKEAEFEEWCDEIEKLAKGYTTIHYRAMKLSRTKHEQDYQAVLAQLEKQDLRERRIKHSLYDYFREWKQLQEKARGVNA